MTHCIEGAATTKSSIAVLVWWKWTNFNKKIHSDTTQICTNHVVSNYTYQGKYTFAQVSTNYDTLIIKVK